jgi:hypothetical protein
MISIEYKQIQSFDQIVEDAKQACELGAVQNLVLAYEFSPDLIHSQFIALHRDKAEQWQSEKVPPNLFFTHGQYFQGDKGIRHIIKELKEKSDSRRALLTLGRMEDLLESGDKSIPSFLISQFAVKSDALYVTEYFRAIEVEYFLPINITEVAIVLEKIMATIAIPRSVRLLILAFQAHRTPSFHCLEKAPIDMIRGGEVGVEVANKNYKQLIEWLDGKKLFESQIEICGLEELEAAVQRQDDGYSAPFKSLLPKVISTLRDIKLRRGTSSNEASVGGLRKTYLELVDSAIAELRRLSNGH